MKHYKHGFTLIELLLVIAIIAVLVVIMIPVVTSQQKDARSAVCAANRRSLKTDVAVAYTTGKYASYEEAFQAIYTQEKYPCPDGGTYIWESDGGIGHAVCSIHGGDESDSSSGASSAAETYLTTGLSVQTDSIWPQSSDYTNPYGTITVKKSGIFKYSDGNYYIVNRTVGLTMAQAATGPGGDACNWFATQKLTGTIVVYSSDSEQKSTLKRGDLCKVGSSYYVFVDGGSWAHSPSVSPNQWYLIPG